MSLTSVGLVGPNGRAATLAGGPRSFARTAQDKGWRSSPELAHMTLVGGNRVNWWRNQGQPGATFKVAGNWYGMQHLLQLSIGKPALANMEGKNMNEEGWYVDPFGHHEARWISKGAPTALVRDGGFESQDPPPSTVIEGKLEHLAGTTEPYGDDMRRADDAEKQSLDPVKMTDAAEESIDSSW